MWPSFAGFHIGICSEQFGTRQPENKWVKFTTRLLEAIPNRGSHGHMEKAVHTYKHYTPHYVYVDTFVYIFVYKVFKYVSAWAKQMKPHTIPNRIKSARAGFILGWRDQRASVSGHTAKTGFSLTWNNIFSKTNVLVKAKRHFSKTADLFNSFLTNKLAPRLREMLFSLLFEIAPKVIIQKVCSRLRENFSF